MELICGNLTLFLEPNSSAMRSMALALDKWYCASTEVRADVVDS